MQTTENNRKVRQFVVGENPVSLGVLPIDSKYQIPPITISAEQKKVKLKGKDDKTKYDRQYTQRSVTFKLSQNKSYHGLVNQLPQPGYKKEVDKCMALLKIDENGKVSFNFCNQKQDFKLVVNLVENRNDIFKMQQQSQLRLMDGRRRNDGGYNFYQNEQDGGEKKQGEEEKLKEKKIVKKTKAVNSDEEDDPYSGKDSD